MIALQTRTALERSEVEAGCCTGKLAHLRTHAGKRPGMPCSTRSPRPSPLGSEVRLLAVGVLLGVDGGQ
ncbi:hypothetical protein EYF80_017883 [Liparis tanakae]|uniref:Uncharacterized protein n=1 Tax=Liparis tanakae TaxID=230148 RepID=A0A4Z2I1E3_9TELE|nr:hypothetical protein EYF80_017883 [Liparis tanakae]